MTLDGRILSEFTKEGEGGKNIFRLNTNNLSTGVYLLQAQTQTGFTVQKISIQK